MCRQQAVQHLLYCANHQQGFQYHHTGAEEVQTQGTVAVVLQECHQEAKPHEDHDSNLRGMLAHRVVRSCR